MKKKTLVHICPKCGSTDVKSILLFSPLMANTSAFVCKNCDYNGICPEIEVSQIEKFRKRLKQKK